MILPVHKRDETTSETICRDRRKKHRQENAPKKKKKKKKRTCQGGWPRLSAI